MFHLNLAPHALLILIFVLTRMRGRGVVVAVLECKARAQGPPDVKRTIWPHLLNTSRLPRRR